MFKYSTGTPPPSWYLTMHLLVFLVSVPPFCCTVCPTLKLLFVTVYCQRLQSVAVVCFLFVCLFVCLFVSEQCGYISSVLIKNLFLIHGFLSHSLTSSLSLSFIFLYWNLKKKKGFRNARDSSTGQVLTWIGLVFNLSIGLHRAQEENRGTSLSSCHPVQSNLKWYYKCKQEAVIARTLNQGKSIVYLMALCNSQSAKL